MSTARRLSVDEHAKSYGGTSPCRSHHKIEIACMEPVRDSPVGLVHRKILFPRRPISLKCPLIEAQPDRESIDMRLVPHDATGGCIVLRLLIADVGLRRPQRAPIGRNFGTTWGD